MRNYAIKCALLVVVLTMLSAASAVKAQTTSDVNLSISVNPGTVSPGGTVGVFATVTNTTSSKLRTPVTITSLAPCGTQTVLGTNRLALLPGQTIQVTVSYPVPADACLGNYIISVSTGSGGGKRTSGSSTAAPFASASLMVQ